MRITPRDLQAQMRRAHRLWSHVIGLESKFEFPRGLLYALGSRETNLAPYCLDHTGDRGFGPRTVATRQALPRHSVNLDWETFPDSAAKRPR